MIEILNISKSFGKKPVLENFSAVFHPGSNCLMGKSGIGKTTLVNMILGLINPDRGEIKIIQGKTINCVFQENRLIEQLSAFKNVMLVCDKTKKQDVVDLLQQLGLEGSIHCPVSSLSGGMKRRVAIARALVNPADIFIFDEPFAGLDDACKDSVIEIIKARAGNGLLIFITHDALEAKSLGGRIVSMD